MKWWNCLHLFIRNVLQILSLIFYTVDVQLDIPRVVSSHNITSELALSELAFLRNLTVERY